MKEVYVFQENENYNIRRGTHLANRNMHTAHFGTGTIMQTGTRRTKNCFINHYQFSNL